MPRSLILKFGAIGDVLMAIPAAHRLHQEGHEIDWVCGAAVLPILALYPWINPIAIDDRALLTGDAQAKLRTVLALWRRLAGRSYDLAATLYYDPRCRLLTLPVRARRKILLSHTDRALNLVPGRHHTDEFARILLGWPDEVRPLPLAPVPPPSLPASPFPRGSRRRVVLAPGGAKNLLADDLLRRWQMENYVALATRLMGQGIEVVLTGGPGDAWVQPHFAALAAAGYPLYDFIGQHTLPQTLALLDEANVLVTHDTGPLHMGGVTRCSIAAIFGPTDPRGRLPQRAGTVALWGGEGFACRPCYDGNSFPACPANDCMAQVTPGMVHEQVTRLLEQAAEAQRILSPTSTAGSPIVFGR